MWRAENKLLAIKIAHTIVWAFFVMSIVGIPIFAAHDRYRAALALIGVVFLEVLVLVFNGWRCPLTGMAARYTPDRRHNFDIYLPELIARFNKQIFGFIYVAGVIFLVIRWMSRLRGPGRDLD